jgi:hypothetical protein
MNIMNKLPKEVKDFFERNNVMLSLSDLSAYEEVDGIFMSGCITSEFDIDIQWQEEEKDNYIIFGRLINEGNFE